MAGDAMTDAERARENARCKGGEGWSFDPRMQPNWRNWSFGLRWSPQRYMHFVIIDLGPWALVWGHDCDD